MFRTMTKILMGVTAASAIGTTVSVVRDVKHPVGEIEEIQPISEIEPVCDKTVEDVADEILNSAE